MENSQEETSERLFRLGLLLSSRSSCGKKADSESPGKPTQQKNGLTLKRAQRALRGTAGTLLPFSLKRHTSCH